MSKQRAVFLHELRPPFEVDDDLDWFWNRAEGDLGVRSNLGATLGPPGERVPTPADLVDAAARFRRVRGALLSLADADIAVLAAAYQLRAWPLPLFDVVGRLTGIVVALACEGAPLPDSPVAFERLLASAADWLVSLGRATFMDPTFARLWREAEVRYARAHRAYGESLRRCERRGVCS